MRKANHVLLRPVVCAAALALAGFAMSPAIAWGAAAPEEEAALQSYLRLGESYERQGLLKDAEAAYQKVLESESPETRGEALAALERIAAKRSSERLLHEPLRSGWASGLTAIATAIFTLAAVLFLIWILRPVFTALGKKAGAGTLGIAPTIDATREKLGSTFDEILKIAHEYQSFIVKNRPGLWRPGATVPSLVRPNADLADVIESAVPGGLGKVIAWLMRKLVQSEYLISSVIQSSGRRVSAIVRVSRLGDTTEEWTIECAAADVFEEETATAIAIMEYLTR